MKQIAVVVVVAISYRTFPALSITFHRSFGYAFRFDMSEPPAIPSAPNVAAASSNPIAPVAFLDVPYLLEASQPRARAATWFMPGLITLLVLTLVSAYFSSKSASYRAIVDVTSGLLMIGIVIAMMLVMWNTVRRQREERAQVEAIEELVQLRRWQQAALMLQRALSQPTVSPNGRVQFLFYLASVLARYNRFDDAIAVQNHLLEEVDLDASTNFALRLGRAMAMLREDHLFDADRAINELRRDVSRATDPSQPESEAPVSGGLALIEIYRDVKTGHANEAIETFNRTRNALREQLGHRVADAHALIAKAHDFLDDSQHAQLHWERATLLSPAIELTRRYPELSSIAAKYQTAGAPPEALGAEAMAA